MRRVAWLLLTAVTAAGILLLFVFPGRTLLAQNRDIAVARQHISALDREDATLRQEKAALTDPNEVEQIARLRFGLVLPGQEAYDITAPPGPTSRTHPVVTEPPSAHHSVWRDLEFWR